jgi:hypothetical protein
VQIYLDPATPGPNDLHVTFFDPRGAERPITGATATATGPSGQTVPLQLEKLSAGHFSASTNPAGGRWRYEVNGSANGVQVGAEVTIPVHG